MVKIESITVLDSPMADSAIICLPGRGQSGLDLALKYQRHSELYATTFVAVTPKGYAWYPLPRGPNDQQEALDGLVEAREAICEIAFKIERDRQIPLERIAITGFSAGAVVALDTFLFSGKNFAAVVGHSGACFQENLPFCRNPNLQILLTHAYDDSVFSWDERYVPMRERLRETSHPVSYLERTEGGHQVTILDVQAGGYFASKALKYSHWGDSRTKKIAELVQS